ncbi:exonuclease-endonuclease-phosphatase domain-containing protein (plasmid) [Rhizobium sp. Kim5]|nr:exonuclease-endonuclease-phosphatase domain-containing protein [Rhizobium sp. Kim5]
MIASYNVNGVNGRLEVLLRWIGETARDVCLLPWCSRSWPVRQFIISLHRFKASCS